MSDEDDDEESASPAQAFAGLQEHVDGYKSYLGKLKKGSSSGISSVFGLAKELLPEEHLKEYIYGGKRFDLDQSILKDGSPPGILRQALEQTIAAFHTKSGQSDRPTGSDDRIVLGEILEDGKRFFVYSDLSIEEAAFRVDQPEPGQAEDIEEIDPLAAVLGEDLIASIDALQETEEEQSTPPEFESQDSESVGLPNVDDFESDEEELDDSSALQASDPDFESTSESSTESPVQPERQEAAAKFSQSVEFERTAALVAAAGREVDLKVETTNGEWLWDVIFSDGEVAEIILSDGTCILRTKDPAKYVLVPVASPGRRAREAQIVAAVLCDRATGNLFFRTESGDQAVALLNNGFRIDQFSNSNGEDRFFVTEPLKPGQFIRNTIQVRDLNLDPLKQTVSYETIDGGMLVTARFRKL